jgi:hypothetical protein
MSATKVGGALLFLGLSVRHPPRSQSDNKSGSLTFIPAVESAKGKLRWDYSDHTLRPEEPVPANLGLNSTNFNGDNPVNNLNPFINRRFANLAL